MVHDARAVQLGDDLWDQRNSDCDWVQLSLGLSCGCVVLTLIRVGARANQAVHRGRVQTAAGALSPVFMGYAGTNETKFERGFWGTAVAPNTTCGAGIE